MADQNMLQSQCSNIIAGSYSNMLPTSFFWCGRSASLFSGVWGWVGAVTVGIAVARAFWQILAKLCPTCNSSYTYF